MRKYLLVALVFSLALAVHADFVQGLRQVNNVLMQVVPPEEQAKTQQEQQPAAETVKKPKYIFYFIGDGMGINQVQMGVDYMSQTTDGKEELNLQKFPIMGANRTYCSNAFVTDSSASGTALATGYKTNYGVAGIDVNGDAVDSIAVFCHDHGMKVGIVATVTLMEATPGAFFMHQGYRGRYYPGAYDLVDSGFEYFAGGDVWDNDASDFNSNITPENYQAATNIFASGVKSCLLDKDGKPVIEWKKALDVIKDGGYKYVDTEEGFNALQPGCGKVYVSHPCKGWGIPYRVGYKEGPFLKDFVKKGIELLDNENGFFMMCEGSFIDHGGHSNDAPKTLYELLDFDDAIGVALEFYKQHPDETLIVVTADHETGAMSYGYVGDRVQDMKYAKCEFSEFKNKFKQYRDKVRECQENHSAQLKGDFSEVKALIKEWYGDIHLSQGKKDRLKKAFKLSMDPNYDPKGENADPEYEGHDPFCFAVQRELNAHFGAKYNTGGHSAAPTPVFSIGVGAVEFGGFKENTNNAISMAKLVDPEAEFPRKPYKKAILQY